jgi:ATP-dependent DNA helicase DinG
VETEKVRQRGQDSTRIVLKACPVSVAEYLHNRLWSKVPTVLVSATLQIEGKFDFIASRLGITSGVTLVVESPFDFAQQGLMYVPRGLPVPKGADTAAFEAGATEEIVDLVKVSRGRALVLFTSVKHEQATAAAIRKRNRFGDYRLMVQGEASNKLLSEQFKTDISSVLFGLKSFMTGVDFQGETLSLLVVSKMPFPVPSEPITEARMERIVAEGGSSFGDYMLPVMSLVIQQAFGRAIRHTTDRAVVVCLDPRLADTGYGKKIQHDLPPFPVTRKFEDVEEFFQQH